MKRYEGGRNSTSQRVLYLVGIMLGLLVGACAIALMVYPHTDRSQVDVVVDIAFPAVVAAPLLFLAVLLFLPDRAYIARQSVRLMALIAGVILVAVGVLVWLVGGFFWMMDEADPGHAGKLPALCAWAVGLVVLVCSGVLLVRGRNASRRALAQRPLDGCA